MDFGAMKNALVSIENVQQKPYCACATGLNVVYTKDRRVYKKSLRQTINHQALRLLCKNEIAQTG